MKTISLSLLSCFFVVSAFASVDPPHKKLIRTANRKPSADSSSYYIIVDKSDFELKVFDEEGWFATYPVVFGSKDMGDKMREGDKKTPNGKYKVILKKIHPKWSYELLLDYPTPENVQIFNNRKIYTY